MKSIKISDAAYKKLKVGAAQRGEHIYKTVDYLMGFLSNETHGRRLTAIVQREWAKAAKNGKTKVRG